MEIDDKTLGHYSSDRQARAKPAKRQRSRSEDITTLPKYMQKAAHSRASRVPYANFLRKRLMFICVDQVCGSL